MHNLAKMYNKDRLRKMKHLRLTCRAVFLPFWHLNLCKGEVGTVGDMSHQRSSVVRFSGHNLGKITHGPFTFMRPKRLI